MSTTTPSKAAIRFALELEQRSLYAGPSRVVVQAMFDAAMANEREAARQCIAVLTTLVHNLDVYQVTPSIVDMGLMRLEKYHEAKGQP